LHPFIKAHPEAVFICLTNIKEKTDQKGTHDAGYKLASEMFVSTSEGTGFPNTTKITAKPNWTSHQLDNDPTYTMGINTDMGFTEGFLNGVKSKGLQDFYIREATSPHMWETRGNTQMCARNNFNLKDLSSKNFWELGNDIIFKKVDGVVFKEVGFMAPMNAPDTFLINMAKFKAHTMGITASIKNLQGITGRRFHQFCNGHSNIFNTYESNYFPFWQPDYMERVAELHKRHLDVGIPRWDSNYTPFGGSLGMEHWINRMLDSFSATPTGINIVEGIYGRDGDGFIGGPHGGRARDYMSNNIIFGKDPFRVDIITHWLAGHEPGNFGLFHIGIERGFSDVLDPFDIPVYLWEKGEAKKVNLDTFNRTPLVTLYLRRDEEEDRYHMVNEPFDYSAWKATGKVARIEPSIKALGTDSNNHIVMDMNVPQKSDVYVDIMNSRGELVHRMYADDLEPGNHQVVWDGFASPGLYTTYVKGMGWDAEKQIVIYT
jgi:uncharacterized protein (DUF362 family)